jgi:hypothetical protein
MEEDPYRIAMSLGTWLSTWREIAQGAEACHLQNSQQEWGKQTTLAKV